MLLNQRVMCAVLLAGAVSLTGCGGGVVATGGTTGDGVLLQGQVHGGQQGISGATLQLYTVGSSGNGSAAIPMLTTPAQTEAGGTFSITGEYSCGKDSSGNTIAGGSGQVYLVATGGNPGQSAGTDNAALALVAALGPCSSLSSSTFIYLNELTTVAAAWALAPFSTAVDHIGASATNTLGVTNAFLDAGLLVNTTTGTVATLPSNLAVETGKLTALADALAGCVNSDGTTACAPLFSAATEGSTPTDTFTAALNIVKHPGSKVTNVFQSIGAYVPFATTLAQSPNDWTMSLTVTGGGLYYPTVLGIDSQSNVWVADEAGPLSAFNPQGKPLSSTGFGIVNNVPITSDVYGLAIDTSDNIWVTNEQGYGGSSFGSITEFYGVNNPSSLGTSPQPYGYNNSVFFPDSIAADTNGNIYVADTNVSSVTVYNGTGSVVSPFLGVSASLAAGQNAVAIDANHGFWLSTNNDSVAHFSSTGALLANVSCCSQSLGIATDAQGDLWIADYLGGADGHGAVAEAVTDSSGNTTVPISGLATGGINYPGTVAVDAAQNVWFTNRINNTVTELAGVNGTSPAGTAVSPSTGVYNMGGYGLDASLGEPYSLLPDRSGNLWITNEGTDTVTMFFGLAAPTATPLQPVPTAP